MGGKAKYSMAGSKGKGAVYARTVGASKSTAGLGLGWRAG